MSSLSEYDVRQLILMQKKINLFENRKLSLYDFFCDLSSLLNVIEMADRDWKNSFQKELNRLEMINDSIEEGSINRWEGNFQEDLNDSVFKIKELTKLVLDIPK